MDLGWSDRAGAGGPQLVEQTVLATRHRAAEGDATGSGGLGLGFVAWSRGDAAVQRSVFAVCVARFCRFWMWRAGRYGFVQLRHNLSCTETGGAGECGGQLERPLRPD